MWELMAKNPGNSQAVGEVMQRLSSAPWHTRTTEISKSHKSGLLFPKSQFPCTPSDGGKPRDFPTDTFRNMINSRWNSKISLEIPKFLLKQSEERTTEGEGCVHAHGCACLKNLKFERFVNVYVNAEESLERATKSITNGSGWWDCRWGFFCS